MAPANGVHLPADEVDDLLSVLEPGDHDLAEIVGLALDVCGASAAGITVRRGEEYHVPVALGIDPFVCEAEDTFCRHTMQTEGVFHVSDALVDPRFADIAWVDGRLARARLYASAPIYDGAHRMIGRLCVIDEEPRELSALQVRTLERLGHSVTQLLELRLLHTGRVHLDDPVVRHAAETMMSRLAAELSHDLRVPLSAIVASVEMLGEELQDHEDRAVTALLTRAHRAAARMVRMLDLGMQLGAAREAPALVEVDLGAVARQLRADSALMLEGAGARLVLEALPVVRADPDEMYSVLQNLLTNAVKFARPGVPPVVVVGSRRTPVGWRISVADNGVGIPPERRRDVFSLFSRVDQTVEGHGIGLATVARIVTALFGRVGIDDGPDGGTEVWFELPTGEHPDRHG
jgi:signal transduction histidine kinase